MDENEQSQKPNADEFDDYNDYVEALTDYKVTAAFDDDHDGPPETDDTEFADNFADDMKSHFKEREQDRQAEAAEDEKEMARIKRHTTEDGSDFRSLKDAMEYNNGEIPQSLGPGSPNPAEYSPDQLDKFRADRSAYIRSGGQKISGNITAYPDDPHRAQRTELIREHREWSEKLQRAEDANDFDQIDRAKYFLRDIDKRARSLPEPPQFKHARDMGTKQMRDSLEMAFDAETANRDDFWTGRVQHDGSVLAAEYLLRGEGDTLILPAETSARGNIKPYSPKSAIKFDSLPANVLRQVRQAVREKHSSDPDTVFRAAWEKLHQLGHGSQGKAAMEKPAKKEKKKSPMAGYRRGMSQSEYEAWRMKNGARAF